MKVLVTGAAGKLGSAVCSHLLEHGYEITATDHKHKDGLMFSDAAELVRAALEKQRPGYHQYYPAQTLAVRGFSAAALIQEFYPGVPLRRPLEQIEALVDISAITDALGWFPRQRASIELAD
ncbi:MAG TPA: NAD-dependent epimerase/dehydratase family protein [Polyangiaceae bacterium]|jgi:nucleoside-diphosphate-sugar epimerase|nr:NAD-dependent epimerase/dehydratase family protein [Polyangiaceae bacterium]